jgi:hypothetical protein
MKKKEINYMSLKKNYDKEKGEELYYSIVITGNDELLNFIISKRIHTFRIGLYPTTKKIIASPITDNWINFFKSYKNYK